MGVGDGSGGGSRGGEWRGDVGLFTRVNYGITTNPKIEHLLLAGFVVPGRE